MATIQAVIVDPDGTVRATEIENSLGSFQAVVGGYIQGVIGGASTIYVNEEGLLIGLPFNPVATLFAANVLGYLGMQLFGTALILGPPDGKGEDTPVRPTVVEYFTKEN
jgi:hypothetical protein